MKSADKEQSDEFSATLPHHGVNDVRPTFFCMVQSNTFKYTSGGNEREDQLAESVVKKERQARDYADITMTIGQAG